MHQHTKDEGKTHRHCYRRILKYFFVHWLLPIRGRKDGRMEGWKEAWKEACRDRQKTQPHD